MGSGGVPGLQSVGLQEVCRLEEKSLWPEA